MFLFSKIRSDKINKSFTDLLDTIKSWCNSLFALDNNTVHKSGDETIDGIKTFVGVMDKSSGADATDDDITVLAMRHKNLIKGQLPTADASFCDIMFLDKENDGIGWIGRMGSIESGVHKSGAQVMRMICFKNDDKITYTSQQTNPVSNPYVMLELGYSSSGVPYLMSPSTRETGISNNDVLTRDWIPKDTRIVHITGDETINGIKTFTKDIHLKLGNQRTVILRNDGSHFYLLTTNENDTDGSWNGSRPLYWSLNNSNLHTHGTFTFHWTGFTHNTKPTNNQSTLINVYDNNDTSTHQIIFHRDTNGTQRCYLRAYAYNDATKYGELISGYDADNSRAFANAPMPPTNSNGGDIATTKWVNDKGYLTAHQSLTAYAKLASPALTGTPTAPTAATSTNNTQIATTAFVKAQGYLTSHQSLTNYVTLNSDQSITGAKHFTKEPIVDTQMRLRTNTYSTMLRNDGNGFYILITNQNDSDGSFSSKRPFWIQLSEGVAYGTTPETSDNSKKLATTEFVKNQGYLTAHQSLSNYVTLDGNQSITGVKTFSSGILLPNGGTTIRANDCTNYIRMSSHDNTEKGGQIWLYGNTCSSSSSYSGIVRIRAAKDGTFYDLTCAPNGHLRWGGHEILTSVDNSYLRLNGANEYTNGGSLLTSGKNFSGYNGRFDLRAYDGTNTKTLIGKPDGTLQWGGNNISVASDERLKTIISHISDDILDAWNNIEWIQFKYKEDVINKGEKNCRFHVGLIAQHVDKKCTDAGVDILKYGLLCHDTSKDGSDPGNPDEPNSDLWTVRYTEALAMEAAYQRRKNKQLEDKIKVLEDEIKMLKEVILNK